MTGQQLEDPRTRFDDKAAEWDANPARVALARAVAGAIRAAVPLRPDMADLDSEDGTFHADPTGIYHHGFERATVCRWLEEAGFADPASREAYRIARPGSDGMLRAYPVFLVTARAG